MKTTQDDILAAQKLRHQMHAHPEISGEESQTAKTVLAELQLTNPDKALSGLGGHGVAAIYEADEPGPTLLFRSELDALPIQETTDCAYKSEISGKGHLCGHDGHTAILLAVARVLGRDRPRNGKVVLLFQPAEEDGSGAAAVLADPQFGANVFPTFCFSLHNMPGIERGHVALVDGPASCASRGMRIALHGKTAHASMPDKGISPMNALAKLMPEMTALGSGGPLGPDFSLATVTHALLGEPAFGIAPGEAELWVTLRAMKNDLMADLCASAEQLVSSTAQSHGLSCEYQYDDVFHAAENHPDAVAHLRRALDDQGVPHSTNGQPMAASEDFGLFGGKAPAAMFFLGAGENHPSLHNPDYDFPDALIPIGANVFLQTIENLLG